jgi:hypothetical protein
VSLPFSVPQKQEAPGSALPAYVPEAQGREGLRLSQSAPASTFGRIHAELDQSRLVGMQLQPELLESLLELGLEPFGILPVLEAHDEIVRETDDDDVTFRVSLSPIVMVQVVTRAEIDLLLKEERDK